MNEDLPDLKDLPPDRWIYLDRDRYCCECSTLIEAGKKVLEFPFTHNIYCTRCSRLLIGKLEEGGRRFKEFMPPVR